MFDIKTVLNIAFVWLVTVSLTGTRPSEGYPYAYVFSPDGRFVKIELSQPKIIERGKVPGFGRIDRLFPDPTGEQILLEASRPSRPAAPEQTAVAVLTEARGNTKGGLRSIHTVTQPSGYDNLVWLKLLDKQRRALLISWQDEVASRTYLLDGRTFEIVGTVDNFVVLPNMCVSSDGQRVYSIRNDESHQILILDLATLTVTRSSYAEIGSRNAYYKAPAALDGCRVLFLEYENKPAQGAVRAKLYLYDLERDELLSSFAVDGDGEYHLLVSQDVFLVDEEKVVPNVLPDRTTVGMRRKRTGKLFFYDARTGKQLRELAVPEDGRLAAVSPDERVGYYLSPKLLTIIDLVEMNVRTKIDLPFAESMLALYKASH
jgi:hypothetical protein